MSVAKLIHQSCKPGLCFLWHLCVCRQSKLRQGLGLTHQQFDCPLNCPRAKRRSALTNRDQVPMPVPALGTLLPLKALSIGHIATLGFGKHS